MLLLLSLLPQGEGEGEGEGEGGGEGEEEKGDTSKKKVRGVNKGQEVDRGEKIKPNR